MAGVFVCFLIALSPQQPSNAHDHGAPRGGHAAYANSVITPEEESDGGDKRPVNADSLSALLLGFLTAILGIFVGGWMRSRDRVSLLAERCLSSVVPICPRGFENSLLKVFRL